MTESDSLHTLTEEIRNFASERDWEKFHDPKSLLLAITGELGELAELFQWIPAGEAVAQFAAPDRKRRAEEEIADVLIYLLRLADVLGVDAWEAAKGKLEHSRARFPTGEVHGTAPLKR